jgi:hypothetical protein
MSELLRKYRSMQETMIGKINKEAFIAAARQQIKIKNRRSRWSNLKVAQLRTQLQIRGLEYPPNTRGCVEWKHRAISLLEEYHKSGGGWSCSECGEPALAEHTSCQACNHSGDRELAGCATKKGPPTEGKKGQARNKRKRGKRQKKSSKDHDLGDFIYAGMRIQIKTDRWNEGRDEGPGWYFGVIEDVHEGLEVEWTCEDDSDLHIERLDLEDVEWEPLDTQDIARCARCHQR